MLTIGLSLIIFSLGAIAIPLLPSGEYPEVVPPSVVVRATYPGANPKEVAESVAVPLEEAINGVEGLMYMKSVAASDFMYIDRKSTRLNSSHQIISYAVFCLKKKKKHTDS